MADVAPFRAIRYAHPSPAVTAPPYDVLTPEALADYRARDPHNVVHLTLNDSEDEAGSAVPGLARRGRARPATTSRPSGPSLRTTSGRTASRAAARASSPRSASSRTRPRTVLPHERTHAGPKEGRLRLLRAAQAQLEPIFLLYDGDLPWRFPTASPISTRATRGSGGVPGDGVAEAFADRQLLIADGHHRYETALAYAEEQGTPESARMMVVLVSTVRPGPRDLPHPPPLPRARGGAAAGGRRRLRLAAAAVERLARLPYDEAHAVGYRRGSTFPVVGEPGELDVELVDRLVGHEGLGYTADLDEAIARVDAGEFDGAFLLRATRIEDVFERARRGEVMPQKTTYFFPKLTSGLLFHPV